MDFSKGTANRIHNLQNTKTQKAMHIVQAHLCRELDEPPDKNVQKADDDGKDNTEVLVEMLVDSGNDYSYDPTCTKCEKDPVNIAIFSVQVQIASTFDTLWGACIDSGAQNTVIGKRQAKANNREIRFTLSMQNEEEDQKDDFNPANMTMIT